MLQYHSPNCRGSIHTCFFFFFLPPPDSTNDQFQPSAYLFMSVLHLVPLCCRCISSSIMWRLGSHASGSDGISLSFLLPGFVEPYACAHLRTHIWFPSLDNLTSFISFLYLHQSESIYCEWDALFQCSHIYISWRVHGQGHNFNKVLNLFKTSFVCVCGRVSLLNLSKSRNDEVLSSIKKTSV